MEVGAYLSASQKKRKQRRKYIILTASIIAGCLLVGGSFWLVFRSPAFRIQNVVVQGNSSIASDDIINLFHSAISKDKNPIARILGSGNMLAWPKFIASSDVALLPQLANIAVNKDYMTRTVTVTVTERKPFAVWCFMPEGETTDVSDSGATSTAAVTEEADEQCFSFATDGVMFATAFDAEGSVIMAVHDYSQAPAPIGSTIVAARFVPNLVSIVNVLRVSGLNVKEVRLNDIGLEEIQATTYDGPDILFSLRFPADEDLPVIQSLMAKPGFSKLQYLDFRTEDRAYYE